MELLRGRAAPVEIEFYCGFRAEERPLRMRLGGRTLPVDEVLAQWRTPEGAAFRVRSGGLILLLREDAELGVWTAEACGPGEEKEAE